MKIGAGELLLILAITLIVFGPSKLPQVGRFVGEALATFRKATSEMSEELSEVKKPFDDAVRPLTDIKRDITKSLSIATDPLKELTKPVVTTSAPEPENQAEVSETSTGAAPEVVSEPLPSQSPASALC